MAAPRSRWFLVLAVLTTFTGAAAADTYWVRPSPHGQHYSDVQCFPGGIAWTAADGGRVARSGDYGATWTLVPAFKPVDLPLSAVAFASPTRGLVVTKQVAGGSIGGKAYLTWDGGLTWATKQLIPSGNLIDADWADSTTALVVSSASQIARTTDGGVTWSVFTPLAFGSIYQLRHVTGSTWYIASVTGLYRSIDNGTSWTSVKSGAYTNVLFADANNGIAVGSGIIVRTTNGGSTWTTSTGNVTGSQFGVAYATSTVAVATTFTGQIVRSVDGGATWTNASMPAISGFPMWAVSFFDASRGLAVGSYGQIESTADGGATWSTSTLRFDPAQGQVDVVYDIARTGPQSWLAAAASGLYRTTDEGATFTRVMTGSWASLSFRDPLVGVAIGGASSGVWRTTDGGVTWTGVGLPKPAAVSTVSFGPGGVALIGSDHYVFRSTDGGVSWTDVYFTACSNCAMYNIGWADANNVFVAGSAFLRSTNGGASFAPVASPASARDVSFATPLVGTAIGGATTFSRTVDGGATWTAPPVQTAYTPPTGLRRIAMSDAYTAWAVGDSGIVMHTINGGGTWTRTPSTTTVPLYALRVLDDSTAVIGGGLGGAVIVLTAHPAEKPIVWNLGSTASSATLYDVAFGDAGTGIICAATSPLLRTTDGGASWSPVAAGGPGTTLFGVAFVDPATAICVGSGGLVLKSTNAGQTWSPVPSGTSSQLRVVAFASATVGCAVGAAGTIIRTTTGGASWAPVTNPAPWATMYGVAFGDASTGVCVGYGFNAATGQNAGVIERTTDGGATWTVVSTTAAFTIDVAFATPSTAVVVAASGGFYATRSTDGGQTWTIATAEATAQGYYGVCFVSATEGYAVGYGGTVARTTDGGLTWVYQPTEVQPPPAALALRAPAALSGIGSFVPAALLTTADLYNVASRAGAGVVAVGAAGTALLHATPPTTAVGDPPARRLAPLALAPVAPNPASRGATIDFALAAAARVRVRIYSVTGAEVARLADGGFTAGRHTLRWDAPRAASGMYFVTVEAGDQRASRKFVVVR